MKIKIDSTPTFLSNYTEDFDVVHLQHGYLQDQLSQVWQYWRPQRAIFLVSPTGSGKTTFILESIVEEILKVPKQKLILVSNRIALDVATKRKIAKMAGLYSKFNDAALHEMCDFRNTYVLSYQQLKNRLNHSEKSFSKAAYVVFDEAHYFTSDAVFTPENNMLLKKIPHIFKNAVRIYITATPAQVLPHITASDCNQWSNLLWQKQWKNHHERLISGNVHYTELIKNEQNAFNNFFWNSEKPSPILYMMPPDFSWMNLRFFETEKELQNILNKNIKILYFVGNKSNGKNLHEQFPDSAYFDADTKTENPDFFEKLLKTEKFDERILFCTTVFENGCNINDSQVKTVIVEPLHPISILQMAGRRRKKSATDSFNLFLKIPTPAQLQKICHDIAETLKLIKESENSYGDFIENLIKNSERFEKIQSLVTVEDGIIVFDQLSKLALQENYDYFAYIKNLIETSGKKAYCELIAEKLFYKDFSLEMLPEDMRQSVQFSITQWLEQQCSIEMDTEKFKEFSSKFQRKCKEISLVSPSENRGKNRQESGYLLIQNRVKEFKLPFTIAKTSTKTYVLLSDESFKKLI